jgi:hypothetical protein
MVDTIRELAAKSGNEEMIKLAIRNDFYILEIFPDDLFNDIAKNGHLKVLELAHSNELDWYRREMLEDAVARINMGLLDFMFNKKPNEFNLSFTRMCIAKGYIEVQEWWKQLELVIRETENPAGVITACFVGALHLPLIFTSLILNSIKAMAIPNGGLQIPTANWHLHSHTELALANSVLFNFT